MSRANSPLEALMLAVREYFELARRYPMRHRLLFDMCEHGGFEAEARRAFETVTGLIAAAQRAGEIRDGDPAEICSAAPFTDWPSWNRLDTQPPCEP